MLTEEEKLALVHTALIQLTGAVLATRTTLCLVMALPTLLISQDQREELLKSLAEGTDHLDKVMEVLGNLAKPPKLD